MKTLKHIPFAQMAHKSIALLLAFCMVNLPVWALDVSDATVSAGAANASQAGNTANVDLITNRVVLDWTQMNATSAETLNFNGANGFAVLNRVAAGVHFDGALNGAGGHVFVISPNGVVIGPNATIAASAFTAAGLDITNGNFMNGVYQFVPFEGGVTGSVTNQGMINATRQVALLGKMVTNSGTIVCPSGLVLMAAGDRVYLGTEGSDVVVEVTGVTMPANPIDGIGDVVNEGTINATDGRIIMAAGDTYVRAIEGLDTLTLGVSSGVGRVGQFGTVTADGSTGDGGSITLTAADRVVLGDDSITTANAGTNGDGGEIIAYSPDTALFSESAVVEAKGGSESGNGGFVEISGKEHVEIEGQIDLSAANGDAGNFLIDPYNITIRHGSTQNGGISGDEWTPSGPSSYLNIDTLESYLNGGMNVTISTGINGTQSGDVTFNAFDIYGSPDYPNGSVDLYDGTDHENGSGYSLTINAARDILFNSGIHFNADGNVTLNAGRHVVLGYSSNSAYAGINLNGGNLTVNANKKIDIGGAGIDLNGGHLEMLGIQTVGTVDFNINIKADITAGSMNIEAGKPTIDTDAKSNLIVADGVTLRATSGDMDLSAREDVCIAGDVIAEQGNIGITADSDMRGKGNVNAGGNIDAEQGSVDIKGRKVIVNTVHAGENINLTGLQEADPGNPAFGGGGLVETHGLLSTDNGDIDIMIKATPQELDAFGKAIFPESDELDPDGLIKLGDDVIAGDDVTLHNNTEFFADADQSVIAQAGMITANGTLTKTSETGSLYLLANDDVRLAGDVTNPVGGVSIISEDGKIYTPDTEGGETDALNVAIEGYSDDLFDEGVDLPFGEGKAAIVLLSHETLELGPDASLHANGYFGDSGEDNRPGGELLAEDGAIIGGYERNEGVPSDIAIYVGSQSGDVIVNSQSPDAIQVNNFLSNGEGKGLATVVLDAYDTVRIPFLQSLSLEELQGLIDSLDGRSAGFRLEVVSRITEWLSQAINNGTLPFAGNPEIMEALLGEDYVLRGAGLDNPIITDGSRAWVLEDPQDVPDTVPAPLAKLEIPQLKGCPVVMDAVAVELGVNSDDLQMLIQNSLASNPNLQPCEACQNLLTAAATLKDADGTRMDALAQLFNTLAPADAPFTPEVSATVATAFANLANDDPRYVAANEYVEAFAKYVATLNDDLKLPVGDSTALVLEKYGDPITSSDNPNIAAYVMAQIQQAGGSL